jgi:hypothetical protein
VRSIIVIAVAAAVVVAGFVAKTVLAPGSSALPISANRPIAASTTTLWPHEIHLKYEGMKELPVHDVKEPF